jgi:hypothetical protein
VRTSPLPRGPIVSNAKIGVALGKDERISSIRLKSEATGDCACAFQPQHSSRRCKRRKRQPAVLLIEVGCNARELRLLSAQVGEVVGWRRVQICVLRPGDPSRLSQRRPGLDGGSAAWRSRRLPLSLEDLLNRIADAEPSRCSSHVRSLRRLLTVGKASLVRDERLEHIRNMSATMAPQ